MILFKAPYYQILTLWPRSGLFELFMGIGMDMGTVAEDEDPGEWNCEPDLICFDRAAISSFILLYSNC